MRPIPSSLARGWLLQQPLTLCAIHESIRVLHRRHQTGNEKREQSSGAQLPLIICVAIADLACPARAGICIAWTGRSSFISDETFSPNVHPGGAERTMRPTRAPPSRRVPGPGQCA
jgi:hypothetical protein